MGGGTWFAAPPPPGLKRLPKNMKYENVDLSIYKWGGVAVREGSVVG